MKKTLEEIQKILAEPPISHQDARKYILREYDRIARIAGYENYADYKFCMINPPLL